MDDRTAVMPEGRVNDDAGRFIQDQRIFILVQNIQRAFFGYQLRRVFGGERQLDDVARAEPIPAFGNGGAVDRNAPVFNILKQAGA